MMNIDLISFFGGVVATVIYMTAAKLRDSFFAKVSIQEEPEEEPEEDDEDEDEEEEREETMEKVPARYSLTEADIKEAIAEWLYNNHDVELNASDVKLHVERKQQEPNTPYRGGMSDWVDVEVFSATAEETD